MPDMYTARDRGLATIAVLEARLIPAMVEAVTLPIGLFWFSWTNFPKYHWIVCRIGTMLFGFSHVSIFLSVVNYLVDGYTA